MTSRPPPRLAQPLSGPRRPDGAGGEEGRMRFGGCWRIDGLSPLSIEVLR